MRSARGPGGPVPGSRRSGFPAGCGVPAFRFPGRLRGPGVPVSRPVAGARPPVHNQPFEWPEYAIPATGKGSAALSG
ncbi:hypothetical protein Slala05_43670 [Streptomyces lavendulae subsp. lavendulae]|nr:hypothetical protein Slala05_43670 [Streptomyces lavendulae subsp. lavendulae]